MTKRAFGITFAISAWVVFAVLLAACDINYQPGCQTYCNQGTGDKDLSGPTGNTRTTN